MLLIAASALPSCNLFTSKSGLEFIPVSNGNEYQFINEEGAILINPQFSQAGVHRDGLACVQMSGDEPLWGYIDTQGKYVVPSQYLHATSFSDGMAWVVPEGGPPTAINTTGGVVFSLQDSERARWFHDGLAAFSTLVEGEGARWGFVNKLGAVVIAPQFDAVGDFSEGRCAVRDAAMEKWGYIDVNGAFLITPQFDNAAPFRQGSAAVNSNGKWGLIDLAGTFTVNPQYDDAAWDGELLLVEQGDRWGWCDKEGTLLINPQFSAALGFNGTDMAPVRSGKLWGYSDREGKLVVNPQFELALPFLGSTAMVLSGRQVGFIGTDGKFVINPQYKAFSADVLNTMAGAIPSDLGIQQLNEEFTEVETDFFNLAAVETYLKDAVTPNGLGGIAFATTLDEWAERFKLDPATLNLRNREFKVVDQPITRDAQASLTLFGKIYRTERRQEGWYTTSSYALDGSATPEAMRLEIKLNGRGRDHLLDLRSYAEGLFPGFTKDERRSRPDGSYGGFKSWMQGPAGEIVEIRSDRDSFTIDLYPGRGGEPGGDESTEEYEDGGW
jgi:hypothetical protein